MRRLSYEYSKYKYNMFSLVFSKLIHGQLEYPIVVNSQGQMIVTIHGCVYKIPEEIERIQLNDTTELKVNTV